MFSLGFSDPAGLVKIQRVCALANKLRPVDTVGIEPKTQSLQVIGACHRIRPK